MGRRKKNKSASYKTAKAVKTVDTADTITDNSVPEFGSISEEAKASYENESFDAETALETARVLLESQKAEGKDEGVEETKGTEESEETKGGKLEEDDGFEFERREYVMSEEEKMMEAFRNGEVYIPPSENTTQESLEQLEKITAQIQGLDAEIGKTPETADNTVVLPDIGTEQLETDSEDDIDSETESLDGENVLSGVGTVDTEVDPSDVTVDMVANVRVYRRDLDRLNDETLPMSERITALGELKTGSINEYGETPDFTEWLTNFYRDSDISANRELAKELIRSRPEWLTFDELMFLASFLYAGTRRRTDDIREWKILSGMYNDLRQDLPQSIPGMQHVTITQWFLEHPKLFQQGRHCFRDLLCREDVPPETVYRHVLYSKITASQRTQLHRAMFVHKNVPIRYKILTAQNLPPESTGRLLIKVMQDSEVEVRVRADIVDLFLNNGTERQKEAALETLEILGADAYNVYNNRENVHNTKITESALAIIESLYDRCIGEIPADVFEESLLSIDTLETLKTKWESQQDFATFKLALLRIELDRQKYGTHQLTLVQILNLVLRFIDAEFTADHELHTRVFEELVDSALEGETCSSGHAFRLVNALGGYTEYNIQVSFDDQLSAYFMREFRRLLEVSEHFDMLLEMGDGQDSFLQKPETVAFIRDNLHTIRESLWEDFREDLDDLTFDETLQRVAVKYGVVV